MTENRVRHNAIMQYLFVFARYVFPFITLPFLTRVLGPDSFGIRAYIIAFMLFIQTVSDFGFNLFGAREIVNNKGVRTADSQTTGRIIYSKLLILFVLAVVSVGFCMASPLISAELHCVMVAFAGVALNTLVPDFLFMGKEKMGIIATRFIISKTLATVLIFALVRSPEDLLLCFIIDAAGSLLAFLLSWAQTAKQYRVVPKMPSLAEVGDTIKASLPFFMSNASVAAMNAAATILVGLFLLSAAEVAYWSLAVTALNAILSLYNPVATALYPHMAHSRDFPLFIRFMIFGTVAALVGAILFALLSRFIMLVLGGQVYIEASYVLIWLAPTLFLAYPALLLGNPLLGALGHEDSLGRSSVAVVLVYIVLLVAVYFCGWFSLVSVAICRVGAELLLLCARLVIAQSKIGNIFVMRAAKDDAQVKDSIQNSV